MQEDKKVEEELIDANFLVAEDYCFVEPGELELLQGDFVVVDFLVGDRCACFLRTARRRPGEIRPPRGGRSRICR